MKNIVIDTNVFITALMSNRGASFKLLSLIGTQIFDISVSVPLILEYEDVAKRQIGHRITLSSKNIDDIIDYICLVAHHQKIFYLWRPLLKDPRDEFVVEVAVSASCDYIISYNKRDFVGIERFGISILTPKEFLEEIGVIS